jgi:hypothetical protein
VSQAFSNVIIISFFLIFFFFFFFALLFVFVFFSYAVLFAMNEKDPVLETLTRNIISYQKQALVEGL